MKKHIFIGLVTVILISAFSLGCWAQEGRGIGRLTGIVMDKDKNPIEGAKLTLEYVQFTAEKTVETDKEGRFAFLGLGKGMVRVKAEKEGFVPGGLQLEVSGANRNPTQYIILQRVTDVKPEENKGDQAREAFSQANALFKEGKYEAAMALYDDFRKQQPDLYKIGINIGNCLLEMKRYNEAISEFQVVVEKIIAETPDIKGNTELAKLYASIGDVYMRQDDLKNAEVYFKKSLEVDPSDHALAYNVAEILFAAGQTEEAIKNYKLAIQIKPDWAKSYAQLGYAYLNQGDTALAIENLKKFLELDPNAPEADGIKEVIKSLGE